MFKIEGLDELTRQLHEAETAVASIDGELGTVNFDPSDPASIERAIADVEAIVDTRLGEFSGNPFIEQLTDQMKEQYREAIVAKAAEARAEGGGTP